MVKGDAADAVGTAEPAFGGVWQGLVGQHRAIATLRRTITDPKSMTNSWLISGPPGSGRSNIALAYAAALLSARSRQGDPDGDEQTAALVRSRSHPDLTVLSTEKVLISIEEVRHLVAQAQFAPSLSDKRVIVIEDADRMLSRSVNVLLKALEEPNPYAVWLLCAPSAQDLLPTVRSRLRLIRLREPKIEEVAEYLISRDGFDPQLAHQVSAEAQGHVGVAAYLGSNAQARDHRRRTLELAFGLTNISEAVAAAETVVSIATEAAQQKAEEKSAREHAELLSSIGLKPGEKIPPQLRTQFTRLKDAQKRYASRNLRDALDRILLDWLSVCRDALVLQLETGAAVHNPEFASRLNQIPALKIMDWVATLEVARERLRGNVMPLLLIESILVRFIPEQVKQDQIKQGQAVQG